MGIKAFTKQILGSSIVGAAARPALLRHSPVTVLMYHGLCGDEDDVDAWTLVRRQDFLRQIDYLRRHYDVVSLDQAMDRTSAEGDRPLAVITFDDGLSSMADILLPIVQRESLPVTIYISTGHIETARPYWFDRVMDAVQTASPQTLRLPIGQWQVSTRRGVENWNVISSLLEALKRCPPDQREQFTDELCEQVAGVARCRFEPFKPLTLAGVEALAREPLVTIGAHTHCHSLLDQIPLDQARSTMALSRERLEQWTGRPIAHFAYPNGNFNSDVARAAQLLGFRSATTTRKRLWTSADSHFEIPRIPVGRFDNLGAFGFNLLFGHVSQ